MIMRVRNQRDVRFFTVAVSLVVLLGSMVLRFFILPDDLASETALPGAFMAVMISAPIAFFVGQRMQEIHELAARLEHEVYHDLLTGVCTRSRFHECAAELGDECSVVIVADIDHFKSFNDRYGHHAGDLALRQFAAILADTVGPMISSRGLAAKNSWCCCVTQICRMVLSPQNGLADVFATSRFLWINRP